MYSEILKSTKTIDQREQLAIEIDSLLTSLFQEGKNSFENALCSIRTETSQIIRDEFLKLLGANGRGIFNNAYLELKSSQAENVSRPHDLTIGEFPQGGWNKDSPSKEMIKDFLTKLKEKLQDLKTVKLTIAFSPSQNSVDSIYDWVGKNVGQGYILDIEVDQEIIGGAKISFKGRYLDLSLKKTLDEVFKDKRKEISISIES